MNMTLSTRIQYTLAALLLASLLFCGPAVALADQDDHTDTTEVVASDEAKMLLLIDILKQLIALLQQQAVVSIDTDHTEGHEHTLVSSDTLSIVVEVHDGRTHVHVYKPGEEVDKFFLDDIAVTDRDDVIAAVVTETNLDELAVESAITFPAVDEEESDHVHGDDDSHDTETSMHDDTDLDGIHIMADGTVMLGSGEVLEGAEVTDDGMIMLSDGDLVEPEFDLL